MTGPEHYLEAENRLRMAWEEGRDPESVQHLVAEAQVHATLALVPAPTVTAVELETEPAVAYVYRAAWDTTPLGTYTNPEAARMHCEADAINHNPPYETGHVFDWLGDDSEPDAPHELVIAKDGVEDTTEYTVTRITVAAEYDPEADA